MLRHNIIGAIVFVFIVGAPAFLHAAGFTNPTIRGIGGRIVATQSTLQATITCAASYGPFLLFPFNIAPPGPYFIRLATNGTPKMSGYFLGTYSLTPDVSTCFNSETGAPIPSFGIKLYGVSK